MAGGIYTRNKKIINILTIKTKLSRLLNPNISTGTQNPIISTGNLQCGYALISIRKAES
jgi:hypothetical protein